MTRSKTKSNETWQEKNKRDIYDGLMGMFFNIATTRFKWTMPKEIPIRYPEKHLYEGGMSVFFEMPGMGYMCLPVATANIEKNVYGEPAVWSPVALGEMSGEINSMKLTNDNSVLIRNNNQYTPSMPFVEHLVKELVNIDITTRMNVNAQKMPISVVSNKENVLSNKNLFNEYFEGDPVIFSSSNLTDVMEIYYSNVPFVGNQLSDMYNVYKSRILSYLGIRNTTVDKKERVLMAEAENADFQIDMVRADYYNHRLIACEEINDRFGLNVTCEDCIESLIDQNNTDEQNTGDGDNEE